MRMFLNLYQKSEFFKILLNHLACFVAIHALIFTRIAVEGCVIIQNLYLFKVVSLSDFKIIGIVCRSNLYAACSEFLINIFIGNYGYFAVCKR